MVSGPMTFKPNKGGTISVIIEVESSSESIMELAPNYGKPMGIVPVQTELPEEIPAPLIEELDRCISVLARLKREFPIMEDGAVKKEEVTANA